MSFSNYLPPPLNAAWSNPIDPNDEELLELEETAYEEELKQNFTQDINNNIPGMEIREEEEEEEAEEVEDMEEYGEEMQVPEI